MEGIKENESIYGGDEYNKHADDEYTCNTCGEKFALGDGDTCPFCNSTDWVFTPSK